MAKVIEYKDNKGEHRIKVVANNGEIIDSTTEGFTRKENAINNRILASVALIKEYSKEMSSEQKNEVLDVIHQS
jgi:uncharacterized protein YegP (UPF0339 family)